MKITVLVDNNTYIDNYYFAEPGLSFYIEDKNKKILFDTGYSDIFLLNAKKMNINLDKLTTIVISHGHNDHTGGLKYLKKIDTSKITMISHPGIYDKRFNKGIEIGSPITKNKIKVKKYIETKKPYKITKNLYFLGEIERTNNFEAKGIGTLGNNKVDYVKDDSCLVYKTCEGLFIISACSHSGICNICEYAKKIFNDNRIIGIIGGFHLLKNDSQLEKTIKYFKKNNIKELYPCHCVSLYAKAKMMKISNVHEVAVGLKISV